MVHPSHNRPRFSLASLFGLVTASAVILWLYFAVYPFGPLLAWFCAAAIVAVIARHLRNRSLGIACALMLGLGVLAVPYFMIEGHSVSPYLLERIHVGSNMADVESTLGSPSKITRDPTGDDWLYSGPTWCHVTISFDADGLVDYIDHDH